MKFTLQRNVTNNADFNGPVITELSSARWQVKSEMISEEMIGWCRCTNLIPQQAHIQFTPLCPTESLVHKHGLNLIHN